MADRKVINLEDYIKARGSHAPDDPVAREIDDFTEYVNALKSDDSLPASVDSLPPGVQERMYMLAVTEAHGLANPELFRSIHGPVHLIHHLPDGSLPGEYGKLAGSIRKYREIVSQEDV